MNCVYRLGTSPHGSSYPDDLRVEPSTTTWWALTRAAIEAYCSAVPVERDV